MRDMSKVIYSHILLRREDPVDIFHHSILQRQNTYMYISETRAQFVKCSAYIFRHHFRKMKEY